MGLLDHLIPVIPIALKGPLTTEERSVLRVPAVVPAVVRHGPLVHRSAGAVSTTTPPERVCVFLAPGATFEGIADSLAPLYAAAATGGGPAAPTREQLARALVVYAKDHLHVATWRNHLVGFRLVLPIEIDAGTGAWIVNADDIRTWSAAFVAAWQPKLRTPPTPLPVPDAFKIESEVTAVIAAVAPLGAANIDRIGVDLRERALRNPFEATVRALALLRAADRAKPGAAVGATLGAVDGLSAKQAALLATTSGGNGILRRYAAVLTPPPPAGTDAARLARCRTLLDNALKQGPAGARTFVPHQELPLTAGQLKVQAGVAKPTVGSDEDPPGGLHRLVLGRDLAVGRDIELSGRVPLAPYLKADAARLDPPPGDPKTKILLKILAADAPDLGLLDGVRARGAGLLTAGLDRWAATAGDKLPAVLGRFQAEAPDEFDLYFALHGLDVKPDPAGGGKFQLRKIAPDGTSTVMDAAAARTFFGTVGAGGAVTFAPEWAARFRLPALMSVAYRRAQARQVLDRLRASLTPFNPAAGSLILARGLRPFPTTYPAAFDPGSAASTTLTKAVTDELNGTPAAPNGVLGRARIAHIRSADTLACALVDLTTTPGAPPYGRFEDEKTFNTASMTKVAPMYAAHELRFRVQALVDAAKLFGLDVTVANWHPPVVAAIRQVWPRIVLRGFPADLDVSYPRRFPDLDVIFEFPIGGTVKFRKGTAAPAEITAVGEFGRPTGTMSFFDWLTLMVLWSNNIAAGMVIGALRYPYINGALRDGGFFDPRSKVGIWMSGDYTGADWKPLPPPADYMKLSDRGKHHYKSTSNFVGNARQFARLLTLAATNKLFDADSTTCGDLIKMMLKQYDPALVPPLPPGVTSFIADAVGLPMKEVASKIGIGVFSPDVPGRAGICDCVVVKRTVGARTFHYVAVVVGGYDRGLDPPVFDEVAKKLDGCIAAAHP